MRERLGRAADGVRISFTHRRTRTLSLGVAAVYLVGYLVSLGDVVFAATVGDLVVVADPLARAVEPRGSFRFEPVARVNAYIVTVLVAPGNVIVGSALAALVAANAGVAYYAWTHSTTCGRKPTAGVVAALPALLSGSACCAPTLLVVLGVQATASVLSVFGVLVPAAAALLVGSLFASAGRVG